MLVVLSPHLDDAVLAVGAAIAVHPSVEVLSVFTDGPAPDRQRGRRRTFGDYVTRRGEDDRALAVLGARTRRLGLHERLFRDPPLRRGYDVFRTPPTVDCFTELGTVEAAVTDALADPSVQVMAPLGIGNHVDHVEVAVAAMRVARAGAADRILFYEDFYALSERARRRHPVSRALPLPPLPHVPLPLAVTALLSRGPASSAYVGGVEWTHDVVVGDVDAQVDAAREYVSQLGVLGGADRLTTLMRRSYAAHRGESVWRASFR